jgi:hypothetical protein
MISVIFYGRNDNHGYNLHKRASLSLNNMAELLTHEDDEILFVDWNTSPGIPTFIESIHDLLTEKAKEITKIIKVDFYTHNLLFSSKTKKQTVEPVARNTAIVRSNPKNKWILSTNTDMIFVPKNSNKSLSDICSELEDGFYELPRFSIPEIIWETFDRLNPESVMKDIKELRLKIDLDEIITAGPILRYDAPGDFQLCLREQLIEIRGFDENMILGWHVDSNLCRRLNILNGETKTLINELYGYHCEHTKTTTHFTATSIQNSLIDFFERVDSPYSSDKNSNWGLSNSTLSEFKVNEKLQNRFESLFEFAKAPPIPRTAVYANSMGNLVSYPESHAVPYLVDALYGYPPNTKLLIFCHNKSKYERYKELLESIGFTNVIEIQGEAKPEFQVENFMNPTIVVLDLGFEIDSQDISVLSHEDINNDLKDDQLNIINRFLKFVIINSQEKTLYETPVITLNLETYDSGAGVFLKKWMGLPQVASNSRVRIGFVKKALKNRNKKTLEKILEKTMKEINFLGSNYFSKLQLNQKMKDKQGIQLTSHQIIPYAHNYSGVSVTRRGLMLQKFGHINFNLSNLALPKDSVQIIELDRPLIDGNTYDVEGTFGINEYQETIKFEKNRNETKAIKYNSNPNIGNLNFSYENMNYNEDHRTVVRLINLGVFGLKKIKKKLTHMRSSDLRSRYFLEDNWSYSNEGLKRWTTNSIFTINLNDYNLKKDRCIALEIKYYKNCKNTNFVKQVRTDSPSSDLEYFEIPRIRRQQGRIVFIFLPANCNGKVIIETNAERILPFEMDKLDAREVYSTVGSFAVAEGNRQKALLLITFPLFMLWVKFVKVCYDVKNKILNFVKKLYRGISNWKT